MEFFTNRWPAGTGPDGERNIAHDWMLFNQEMARFGESLDDAQFIHYKFDEYWFTFDPVIMAIWTKTRVYIPSSDTYWLVEFVPIPPGLLGMHTLLAMEFKSLSDGVISLPMMLTRSPVRYLSGMLSNWIDECDPLSDFKRATV